FWFHTGDSGRMDEDGYFYFVDRKKDALRRRGENISSFELESVVMNHPKVLDCAAVAVPSPLTEDDVKIVVVARPGQTLDAQELWAYCEEHMPRFWVPRYVEFRDALPRTPTQKVEKYKLRAGDGAGAVFDREASAGKAKAS
ncbi:MAG: ATP-dependent acyl-CoA ligase, partial [Reyranellaceae bacterium]